MDIAQDGESWTGQMRRVLEHLPYPFIIRLSEEFFMVDQARLDDLHQLESYMEQHPETYRIGLQTVHEGYDLCHLPIENRNDIYFLKKDADYLSSLEASIYNVAMLRDFLKDAGDMHIWEAETYLSKKAREAKADAIVTEERVLPYKDAMRRGESRHPDFQNIV